MSAKITTVPEDALLTFTPTITGGIDLKSLPSGRTPDDMYEFEVGQYDNAGNGVLTASVTVTAEDNDGNTRHEILQIVQYPYDLLFQFTPWDKYANKYPATGSNIESLYFYTQTARPWEYEGAYNYDNTPFSGFNPISNPSQPASEDVKTPFYFELDPNEGWSERQVIIKVTTNDVNIPWYEFSLLQLYTLPYINNVNPTEVDFGYENAQVIEKSVTFNSNSEWAVTGSGNDYSKVVSSIEDTSGGNNLNSLDDQPYTIRFKNTILSGTNIPGAETTVTASATIKTAAPTNQQDETVVTLKRKVPAYFEYKTVTPVENTLLNRAGATVSVTAETNNEWTLTSSQINGSAATMGASQWGSKIQTIAIKNNDSWQERDLTVSYYQKDGTPQNINYKQRCYYTESGSGQISGSLTGSGGTITVSVSGDFPANSVYVKATAGNNSSSPDIQSNASPTLSASTNGGSATLTIPQNTGSPRDIYFWYQDGASSTWHQIGYLNQATVYNYTVSADPASNSVIFDSSGATVYITVTGSRPAISVVAVEDGIEGARIDFAAATSGSERKGISISANPATMLNRPIQIRATGTDGKTTTFEYEQDISNFKLSTGRIVSKKFLYEETRTTLTWSRAMGIPTNYDNKDPYVPFIFFYTSAMGGPDANNRNYIPTMQTGCNIYSESTTDRGLWRLPTLPEAQEMARNIMFIPNLGLAGYWSSTEDANQAFNAFYVFGPNQQTYTNGKGGEMLARCVRTP